MSVRTRFAVWVCLAVTVEGRGWAEPTQGREDWIEDPYAEHVTRGNELRLGTVVGFLYGERVDALALGVQLAAGHRFDRLALSSEVSAMTLEALGGENLTLGHAERLGVIARYDLARLGSRWLGANSMLGLYVEGGAAVAWNHWYTPSETEAPRVVPADTKRVEGQVGFGVALDHRFQEPVGAPRRVAWFLGWRLALAPHDSDAATVCRGTSCRAAEPMPSARFIDRSMLFQSSMAMTW